MRRWKRGAALEEQQELLYVSSLLLALLRPNHHVCSTADDSRCSSQSSTPNTSIRPSTQGLSPHALDTVSIDFSP